MCVSTCLLTRLLLKKKQKKHGKGEICITKNLGRLGDTPDQLLLNNLHLNVMNSHLIADQFLMCLFANFQRFCSYKLTDLKTARPVTQRLVLYLADVALRGHSNGQSVTSVTRVTSSGRPFLTPLAFSPQWRFLPHRQQEHKWLLQLLPG